MAPSPSASVDTVAGVLAVLAQPLEVEEVAHSFLEGLVGPALIAVAAIVAAFVAAWVARRNHAAQLENERALRDLDHARQSISGAVERLVETIDALARLTVQVKNAAAYREATLAAAAACDEGLPTFRREGGGGFTDTRTPEEIDALPDAIIEAEGRLLKAEIDALNADTVQINTTTDQATLTWAHQNGVEADTLRLRITIGITSVVVDRHKEIEEAIGKWSTYLDMTPDGFVFDQGVAEALSQPVHDAMAAFIAACQVWSADRTA